MPCSRKHTQENKAAFMQRGGKRGLFRREMRACNTISVLDILLQDAARRRARRLHAPEVPERAPHPQRNPTLPTPRAGTYVGCMHQEYLDVQAAAHGRLPPQAVAGSGLSFMVGRLSFTFGLTGPSVSTDTACSSSLVAVHLAHKARRRPSLPAPGGRTCLARSPACPRCLPAMLPAYNACHGHMRDNAEANHWALVLLGRLMQCWRAPQRRGGLGCCSCMVSAFARGVQGHAESASGRTLR